MTYTINLLEDEKSVAIMNSKGDYIILDFPNSDGYEMIKEFVEETDR